MLLSRVLFKGAMTVGNTCSKVLFAVYASSNKHLAVLSAVSQLSAYQSC